MTSRHLVVSLLSVTSLYAQPSPQAASSPTPTLTKLVDSYCQGCHNGSYRSISNGVLRAFDPQHIAADAGGWSKVYRQLQAGTMPPAGLPRPDRTTYDAALAELEKALPTPPAPTPTSQAIATRLATMLWNAPPDDALSKDAAADRLHDPATVERHVRRMLADPRAESFIARFFAPWLQLDQLSKVEPKKELFPDYDPSLREAFSKETELFLLSQLREDWDPIDLWTANYTYLNAQLAKHYGVPNVNGSDFKRVKWTSPERYGLLGQGSVLMLTSRAGAQNGYTSPASRGKWVRTHLLGVEPPNPAPNVPAPDATRPLTPQSRAFPQDPCRTCHNNFFPLGWGLEHFDPLGRARTTDQIGPADATGQLVDGTTFNGTAELSARLLARPDAFRTAITEQLIAYAQGAPVKVTSSSPETLIEARHILGSTPKPRWSAIIAAVARSTPAR